MASQKAYKSEFQPDKKKQDRHGDIYTYLPLSGHATVASGDTNNETVVISDFVGL